MRRAAGLMRDAASSPSSRLSPLNGFPPLVPVFIDFFKKPGGLYVRVPPALEGLFDMSLWGSWGRSRSQLQMGQGYAPG